MSRKRDKAIQPQQHRSCLAITLLCSPRAGCGLLDMVPTVLEMTAFSRQFHILADLIDQIVDQHVDRCREAHHQPKSKPCHLRVHKCLRLDAPREKEGRQRPTGQCVTRHSATHSALPCILPRWWHRRESTPATCQGNSPNLAFSLTSGSGITIAITEPTIGTQCNQNTSSAKTGHSGRPVSA